MEKLTDNEMNSGVLQSMIDQLPASHPYVRELQGVMDKKLTLKD